MRRGTLRVYLGAAPGVGKTFAMLGEGHRRRERGTDVVVGFVETHGREHTAALTEGLEVVPRRRLTHRGATFEEMDLDAVLARRPAVALVDELAHTNVPGSRHTKRWEDVEELLAAGIDVITTVNVQHLESLNDVVAEITGVRQGETVPDQVVRRADQVELVDMAPQALRRRLAHGNVYAAEKIDAALDNYFRLGNLTALRELALLWVADRVDDALEAYRCEHDISTPWKTRERVVVALTGGAEGEALIRRGARITDRATGAELVALHVSVSDGLSDAAPDVLTRQRALVESLGGTWHTVVADDVAATVLSFARQVNATQIVLGASRRGRLSSALFPGVGPAVVRDSGEIDVHIVTHEHAGRGRRRRPRPGLGLPRRVLGWALAVAGQPLLALLLHELTDLSDLPAALMLFLALTVAVALVGGMLPAVVSALIGGSLANYAFTPPLYTLVVDRPTDAVAIGVLLAVAVSVSVVVDQAARRTAQAAQARNEADTLATLAGSVLTGSEAVPALLDQLCEMYGLDSAALLAREDAGWNGYAVSGRRPPSSPEEADSTVPIQPDLVLALRGRVLPARDLRVVTAVATQTGALIERDLLRAEAEANRHERERTALRTTLLAAVSHDLRTPLAGIKASVSGLRVDGVELSEQDRAELLAGIEESADQLNALVDNLLDMGRLDSGAVTARRDRVALDEVVPRAVAGIPADRVRIDVPETLPLLVADAGLLERAVANVVENAVRHSPPDRPVVVTAGAVCGSVVLRVVDRGPGVPPEDREQMFTAFQRLGDRPLGHGVGLGLAVARGFTRANGGTLDAEDTPGGGLTMVFTFPVPPGDAAGSEAR
ncbi:sensor histidine kinase KdpD [Desertihabitans brevis]|uniref:histidine kinase n=1 Tax=Desertihabitans brevis TaxID=2268447 RepID=A0A367YV48_9ACTN|nr:sensor histidine kinase KdpD [Desertihabitans brevis]RCK69627.1 sensor histidine kinase KdpD [Desertihabitans brevis]